MGVGLLAAGIGASAAGNLINTGWNIGSTFLKRKWDLEDRDYQASREDSAYQRQVADMKAAGINPALAGGSGGGASSAAQADSSIDKDPVQGGSILSTALQLKQMSINQQLAQAALGRSNAALISSNAQQMKAVNDSNLTGSKKDFLISQSALNNARTMIKNNYLKKLATSDINKIKSAVKFEAYKRANLADEDGDDYTHPFD